MTDEKEKHVLMHIWQRWLRDPHTGVQSCAMGANLEACPANRRWSPKRISCLSEIYEIAKILGGVQACRAVLEQVR